MDKFYVGQRVKVTRSPVARNQWCGRIPAGGTRLGTVIEGQHWSGVVYGYSLQSDDVPCPDPRGWIVEEQQLEPIFEADSFDVYMGRVQKSVDLAQPVAA